MKAKGQLFQGALDRGDRATTELVAERDKLTLLMCVSHVKLFMLITSMAFGLVKSISSYMEKTKRELPILSLLMWRFLGSP